MKKFDIHGEDHWSFSRGGDTQPGVKIVRTPDEWDALWKGAPPGPLPEGSMAVVVNMGERDEGPWGLGVKDVREEKGKLVLDVERRGPQGIAMQSLFQAYAIKLVEASDKDIVVNTIVPPSDHTRCLRPGPGPLRP